jgi:hypothetical protein
MHIEAFFPVFICPLVSILPVEKPEVIKAANWKKMEGLRFETERRCQCNIEAQLFSPEVVERLIAF